MKIKLYKPQREALNAVLAYHYEPPDDQGEYPDNRGDPWWYSYWATDAKCENNDCLHEHGAGDCELWSNGTEQHCF